MAAGRALLLSLEWALDRADPELVRSLDAQMDSLSISLGGNTAIRTRRLLFWLKCFSTTGGDFTQASQWLEELRGLLRWREEGIEREYIAVRLAIRTQLVLQHLTSGGDSWKAAKRALERCFPSEGASRGPSDGDERARYYSLDSAIRAAQRRETQRVVSTRERHPEAAVLEQVHAFVRQVKRLLRPPALLLLDAEGRLAREPVGAPADQAHCACSGHAHSRGNASPRASPPLHSIANDHAAPAPPMPPSAAPPSPVHSPEPRGLGLPGEEERAPSPSSLEPARRSPAAESMPAAHGAHLPQQADLARPKTTLGNGASLFSRSRLTFRNIVNGEGIGEGVRVSFSDDISESSASPRPVLIRRMPNAIAKRKQVKPRIRWTATEEENLRHGVDNLKGHEKMWATILSTYEFHPCRTAVDLKDKWRNITKNG